MCARLPEEPYRVGGATLARSFQEMIDASVVVRPAPAKKSGKKSEPAVDFEAVLSQPPAESDRATYGVSASPFPSEESLEQAGYRIYDDAEYLVGVNQDFMADRDGRPYLVQRRGQEIAVYDVVFLAPVELVVLRPHEAMLSCCPLDPYSRGSRRPSIRMKCLKIAVK